MRIPTFTSEYGDTPLLEGEPLTHAEIVKKLSELPDQSRIESSQQQIILDAVNNFYLAKRFHELTEREALSGKTRLTDVLAHIARQLMKAAVISIASANDMQPRTRSLYGVLELLASKANDGQLTDLDRTSAREAIDLLQLWTKPEKNKSLLYVRHLRNKWAGHASFDREFDDWADADKVIHLPHVEKALEILVNAHVLLAQLMNENPFLAGLADTTDPKVAHGARSLEMTVDWSAIDTFAAVMKLNNALSVGLLGDLLEEAVHARGDATAQPDA